MTTIDALNRHLDETPADQTARLALADALVEEGLEWGLGFQALARLGVWPEQVLTTEYVDETGWWFHGGEGIGRDGSWLPQHALPPDWFKLLHAVHRWNSKWARADRRDWLETAAAQTFLLLPLDRQQQLLTGARRGKRPLATDH